MTPKTRSRDNRAEPAETQVEDRRQEEQDDGRKDDEEGDYQVTNETSSAVPQKRKNGESKKGGASVKAAKLEGSSDNEEDEGMKGVDTEDDDVARQKRGEQDNHEKQGKAASLDPSQILVFLLSPPALALCVPSAENDALSSSSDADSPVSPLTALLPPFTELLAGLVLARPISHALGLRTLRTLLSPPHYLSSPSAINRAGPDAVRSAVWDARTQHKEKVSGEIERLAEAVARDHGTGETEEDGEGGKGQGGGEGEEAGLGLERWRSEADGDVSRLRALLKEKVHGLGDTGVDIFFRRVQWCWPEVFPFVDKRTGDALERLGLPKEPKELAALITRESEKGDLKLDGDKGGKKDVEEERRRAFAFLLERAIGAHLEKRVEDVLNAVESASDRN